MLAEDRRADGQAATSLGRHADRPLSRMLVSETTSSKYAQPIAASPAEQLKQRTIMMLVVPPTVFQHILG